MANINKLLVRWKEIIFIVLSVRVFLLVLSFFLNPNSNNLFHTWVRWDGPHYIDIAKNWYQPLGEQALWIVFSPLYPILIKGFNFLINDFFISAILISIIFSFFAAILLFELTLLDFERKIATLAVWFLNIFPTSYFLQASYTESLFLTLSLATIYLFRKNLFPQSGILGLLTTMTRLNGILLIPTLLMESKSIKKSLITFALIPLGTFFYLLINYLIFHDPLYFLKPLQSNWHQYTNWPWISIFNNILFLKGTENSDFYVHTSELVFLLIILISSFYVYLRVRKSYGVYLFITFLFCTSGNFLISTPRHALTLFPIFISLATIKSNAAKILISMLSLSMLIFYATLYLQGKWAF